MFCICENKEAYQLTVQLIIIFVFTTKIVPSPFIQKNYVHSTVPPQKPKIESCFITFSSDCLNRYMTQVFVFHIDLTLTVTMVTENGCQYRKRHFGLQFGGLTDVLFKN